MKLFDLHCDTIYECCETGKGLRQNDLHINRQAARDYEHYAQFFALFCGVRSDEENRNCLLDLPAEQRFARMRAAAEREFAQNADWLMPCTAGADLRAARQAGKAAAFLSVEGAELLPEGADAVDLAYAAGIRMITLTWNYKNRFGCPALLDEQQGLTDEGIAFSKRCAERGITLDVSHLSERGFWDLCEAVDVPFVASHSNCRALCDHPRNLTDAQLGEIARRGGLVGINLYPVFLTRQSTCTIDEALDHIEHIVGMYGGEKTLALGCDLDGVGELPCGIEGLADIGKVYERMMARGYQKETADRLFYDNAAAFFERIL